MGKGVGWQCIATTAVPGSLRRQSKWNRAAGPLHETGLSTPGPDQGLPTGPMRKVGQHLEATEDQSGVSQAKGRRWELTETDSGSWGQVKGRREERGVC